MHNNSDKETIKNEVRTEYKRIPKKKSQEKADNSSRLQNVQTVSGTHPAALFLVRTVCYSQLMPRPRQSGATPPVCLHGLNRHNFTSPYSWSTIFQTRSSNVINANSKQFTLHRLHMLASFALTFFFIYYYAFQSVYFFSRRLLRRQLFPEYDAV
jgi:hypothetical protein